MSDTLSHECGIAFLRLRRPLQYYLDAYGTPDFALARLYTLLHRQRNRGQDGVGVACVKLDAKHGGSYTNRKVATGREALYKVFEEILHTHKGLHAQARHNLKADTLKRQDPFVGELLLGHLRYGTHGSVDTARCHPFVRENNWRSRHLVLAGNFNLANHEELFQQLISFGQHPCDKTDGVTVMEKIGYFLDEEVQKLYHQYKETLKGVALSRQIETELSIPQVLSNACQRLDGGYVLAGILGYGAAFIARDPMGIRPAYYYVNDEVIVATSERPPIQVAFGAQWSDILEIPPAHALFLSPTGEYEISPFMKPHKRASCSFERIYFSRASDPQIYQERKALGKHMAVDLLARLPKKDIKDTVFGYVPNTAEIAFIGLIEELEAQLKGQYGRLRIEKVISKDVKWRTFITGDTKRNAMTSEVYEMNDSAIRPHKDALVLLDDSIVRGTTLQYSLLTLVAQLSPRAVYMLSSAPQIRYPDCYGIDMSRLKDFVAFRAVIELLEERQLMHLLDEAYVAAKQALRDKHAKENHLKRLYAPFSDKEIADRIAQCLKPPSLKAPLHILFQRIKGLHSACPAHKGDWYFTGDYPTPGGLQTAHRSLVHYVEKSAHRAYEYK